MIPEMGIGKGIKCATLVHLEIDRHESVRWQRLATERAKGGNPKLTGNKKIPVEIATLSELGLSKIF